MNSSHHHIIEQVPPDYYQQGVKHNILQRIWHTNKLHEVFGFFPTILNPNFTIMDVGCASGWFLSEINHAYPNAICYGVDIYDKAIDYGKKQYPHLCLSQADAHEIPYKDNSFDIVICTEVLEHADDPQVVLSEIKRVLKKGGVAIIEQDSGSPLFSVVWYVWRKFNGKVWNHAHLHSFNVRKMGNLVKKSGFQILQSKRFNWGMAMVFAIRKK